MKKLFVLLILLLFFGRSQATDIEARTGILGGDGWGTSNRGVYKLSAITVVFLYKRDCCCIPRGIRFHMEMIGILIFLYPCMLLFIFR